MTDDTAPELNEPGAWSPLRLDMDQEKYLAQLNEASAKGTADQIVLFVWVGMRQQFIGPDGYRYLEHAARNTADPPEVVARLVEYATGIAKHPADARGLGYIIAHYANHLVDAEDTRYSLGPFGLELYRAVGPAIEKYPAVPDIGTFWLNRARVHLRTGHLADCVADCDRALAVLCRFPTHAEDVGRTLLNRAAALVQLNALEQARADYESAVVVARKYSPPPVLARALKSYAAVLRRTGAVPAAEQCYAEAIAMLPPDHLEVAACLMDWGNCFAETDRSADAIPKYRAALELMRGREQPSELGLCLMNWGAAHGKLNEWAESEVKLSEALPHLTAPISRMRCLANLALARHMQGRNAEAVAAWRDARAAFRAARRNAGADDTRLAYYAEHTVRLNAYVVPAALAANRPEDGYEAVRDGKAGAVDDLAAQLTRARSEEPADVLAARAALTQWLRTADPRHPDYARDRAAHTEHYLAAWGRHARAGAGSAPPLADDRPALADLQQRLPDRWALVDFWWSGNNDIHAFVLLRDELQVIKLSSLPDRDALIRMVTELRTVGPNEPHLEGLTDLGTGLFAPLLPLLRAKQIAGLYLVPHEFLHIFPLHAARWYEGGALKYLCDEFEVAYLPSANLLPRLPAPDATGGAFVLANPEHGTAGALPFSHWEGAELQKRLNVPDGQCVLGAAGTYAATDRWADCGYVHLSCHGSGDEVFAARSHLRLADDLLLAHDVLHRKPALKPGAVVVLNGCETSVLDWRAVNENMGLMTAFLLRGAGVVLSTQWHVYDLCAAPLALHFAEQVRAGRSPVGALRAAREALRAMPRSAVAQMIGAAKELANKGDARGAAPALPAWVLASARPFDNPVFWAAFQLVGRGA